MEPAIPAPCIAKADVVKVAVPGLTVPLPSELAPSKNAWFTPLKHISPITTRYSD